MHEIKFKAFIPEDAVDRKQCAWFPVGMLEWEKDFRLGHNCIHLVNCPDAPDGFPTGVHITCPPAILLQYTRAKNKNGVEIYEGDIIKGESYPGIQTGIIAWSDTPIPALHFVINGNTAPLIVENCEVIGNIYENPELIHKS